MDSIQKGDLIHIPQGVFLVSDGGSTHRTTDRPRTAIFLNSNPLRHGSVVFLDGKEFMVRSDHIYILTEQEKKSHVS